MIKYASALFSRNKHFPNYFLIAMLHGDLQLVNLQISGMISMINGKISYMPINALVQYLNGMNADNAKSIELITTPPANFDAEGNAGFINLSLIHI